MRFPILFFSFFLFSFFQQANIYAGSQSSWILESNYSKDYIPHEDQASDGLTYLFSDTQVNIDTHEVYHFVSVKVTNENGLSDASSIMVDYDKEFQKLHYNLIQILRKGKVINVLAKQKPEELRREGQLEDGIVDGSLTSYLDVNDLRVGDILEYCYVIKGFNPIKKDFLSLNYYLAFSSPVGKLRVAFFTSEESKYAYKMFNTDMQPLIKKEGKQTVYTWEASDPKVIINEDNVPSWYNPYPKIFFYRNTTWKQLASHMLELYSTNEKLNKESLDILANIKANYKTREEQVREIIRYVQSQIRYLGNENGIYGYKPRHPNVIIGKKSGDCKEKSWTLCMLLKQIGIPAFPVLVNTYKGYKLDEYPAGLESFNHCVACFVLDKDTIFVDPTITNQGGDIHNICFPNYYKGLIISENSNDLTQISKHGENSICTEETYDIKDMSGKAFLNVTTIYYGFKAESQRAYFKNTAKKVIQDNFLEFYANTYPKIDTLKMISFKDDLVNNKFIMYESYQLENIWEAKDSLKPKDVTTYFYANNLWHRINIDNDPDRTSPMFLSDDLNFSQIITVNLPFEWGLHDEKKTIKGPGFKFDREVNYANKILTLKYHHVTISPYISKEEYPEYVAKNEKVMDCLSYGIIYYGTSGVAPDNGKLSPIPMVLAVFILIIGFMMARRIYFYDPESELMYVKKGKKVGGWLVLPAIGIAMTPLLMLVSIFNTGFFHSDVWSGLFNPETSNYTLGHSLLVLFEFTFNILFIVYAILINILFHGKRTSTPYLMIAFYVSYSIFIIADVFIGYGLKITAGTVLYKEVFKSIVRLAIWVPYFTKSERVKQTFTRTLAYKKDEITAE